MSTNALSTRNTYVRKLTRKRYVRDCVGGAFVVITVDTIKNGKKKLLKKGWRWGAAGCVGGLMGYHARRKGWW